MEGEILVRSDVMFSISRSSTCIEIELVVLSLKTDETMPYIVLFFAFHCDFSR